MGYAITMGILLAYVVIGSFLSDDKSEEAELCR